MNTPQDTRNQQSEDDARALLHRVIVLVMIGLALSVGIATFGAWKAYDAAQQNHTLILRVTRDESNLAQATAQNARFTHQLKGVTDALCGHSPKGAANVRHLARVVRQILVIASMPQPDGPPPTLEQRRAAQRFLRTTLPLLSPIMHYQPVKC